MNSETDKPGDETETDDAGEDTSEAVADDNAVTDVAKEDEPDAEFADEPVNDANGSVDDTPRARRSFLPLFALLVAAAALAGVGWLIVNQPAAPELDFASPGDVDAVTRDVAELRESLSRIEQSVAALSGDDEALANMRSELNATLRRELSRIEERFAQYDSLPPRVGNLENSVAAIQGIDAGARDSLLIAEAEHYLEIANSLLTLGGDVELSRVALDMADQRIVSVGNPALNNVRQAISDELTALELAATVDIESNAMLLSSLSRVVDALPLKTVGDEAEAQTEDGESSDSAIGAVREALFGAVKVTRPGDADTPLLLPGTEPLIRSNLSLQLQAARLALLKTEQSVFEQSLDDADAWLVQYFDGDSVQVQSARETIAEIRSVTLDVDVPDISESLRLLRQYQTLSESAP